MKKFSIILISTILFSILSTQKAFSCLSCGCTGASSVSDVDSVGSNVGVFSRDNRFLVQLGSSFRDINGSFNENGKWYTKPNDSKLQTISNTLRVNYFTNFDLNFSLQFSTVTNILDKGSWGDFGSISPTDKNMLVGTSLGDISLQTSYKLFEDDSFSLTPWINLSIPTGKATGKPEELSGSGFYYTSLGFLILNRFQKFEFINSLGYQIPLTQKTESLTYSLGQSFFYQLSCNYDFFNDLKGGVSFYVTKGFWGADNNTNPVFNIKVSPSAQYSFDYSKGLKLSLVYAPNLYGINTLTDSSLNLVYYNFIK